MDENGLLQILEKLIALKVENEVVEFKKAESSYDIKKLGCYLSALANEANYRKADRAWLVFGIDPQTHQPVGTRYKSSDASLQKLKEIIGNRTNGRHTFKSINSISYKGIRVIMFEIPPAPQGIPISYAGHWYGRDGESLQPLSLEKLEHIRRQAAIDWSSHIIDAAGVDDIDGEALDMAKELFINKNPVFSAEINQWSDMDFLNKAKLAIKGKLTRTALLLLGRRDSEYFLQPADPKIRWVLKDHNGVERDYEIFEIPFLLAVDKVFLKIRNLKYRYIGGNTLFPREVTQYDPYSIREALNNCIAHQDYTLGGRINVIEEDDCLTFSNKGSFAAESVRKVVLDNSPEEHYRNKFLAYAMYNLKMVDTVGGGIRKMFLAQKAKFFPLPEYNLSSDRVKLTLTGKVIDLDYANVLAENLDLSLEEIMALDKLQKGKSIDDDEADLLKEKNLIEGRKPRYYISKKVASATNQKANYTKTKGLDDKYYRDLILEALKQHGELKRSELDELLMDKLPDSMNGKQKKTKVGNLLSDLRIREHITNTGTRRYPFWKLKE